MKPNATLALLILGYAGFYFCRADFSVSKPLIIEELAASGAFTRETAKVALGVVASWATLAYAFGKFGAGALTDLWGGRTSFLLGMAGAVLATVAFALGGTLPVFTLAWVVNRLVQSLGWPGAVRIAGSWFPAASYGGALGALSLSYLFGDAAARATHGALLGAGWSWRGLFWFSAAVLGVLLVAHVALLKERLRVPPDLETSRATEHPARLLRSQAFWCVCVLSLCFTLVRETFNEWSPTYFVEFAKLSPAEAANKSALFPLWGGVAVLVFGLLSDRLGRGGRATLILLAIPVATVLLAALGLLPASGLTPVLVGLCGFFLIGPYSYLAGALALDLGGRKAGATASGLIDGFGYLAGVLAGEGMARLSVVAGWRGAFLTLALVAFATLPPALILWRNARRA
jgi:sugar phosphate permease